MKDVIICGNCANVLAGFPADYIDLTVTSPPYDNLRDYNGYEFDFEPIAQQLYRVTKPGGVVVWVVADATIDGSETCTSDIQKLYFKSLGFNVETMIYKKHGLEFPRFNHRNYPSVFEYMFIFSKELPKTFNIISDRVNNYTGSKIWGTIRNPDGSQKFTHSQGKNIKKFGSRGNVWEYDAGYMKNTKDKMAHEHPAIFPEALARDHIISWSNPGDLILDPFCGSGTTLKMAKEQGRHYIGIDISPEYCALSQRRVEGARVPLFVTEPQPIEPKPVQLEMIE